MAQEFAKKFYNSKVWKDNRQAYFKHKYGICELCDNPGEEVHHKTFLRPNNMHDVNVTMGWDNLILLCKACHNVQHDKAYQLHREWQRKNPDTERDLKFDVNGDLIEHKTVHIVWGAPASGKTTYVKDHKGKYDIVVDLDYIMSALSLSNDRTRSEDTFPFALDVVKLMNELIGHRKYFFEHAWIIVTMPIKADRIKLAKELKAELIHIDIDKSTCLERAKLDDCRADKLLQYKIINKYFDELEV
jgi:predicted kinase